MGVQIVEKLLGNKIFSSCQKSQEAHDLGQGAMMRDNIEQSEICCGS